MNVIINIRHGGFGLSRQALHWLRQRGHQGALDEVDIGEPWDADDPSSLRDEHLAQFLFDIDRDDPMLLAVVDALGPDAAGRYSHLKAVEIPDGVEWEIEEYNGIEWVAEKHRTWS